MLEDNIIKQLTKIARKLKRETDNFEILNTLIDVYELGITDHLHLLKIKIKRHCRKLLIQISLCDRVLFEQEVDTKE